MAVSVISFATYKRPPWKTTDFPALKFVKAVKAKPFTGYADVPVLGRWMHLVPENADDAIGWFGELAAAELAKRFAGPLILVPLPNSSSTVDNGKEPRTAVLAANIAAKLKNTKSCDCLRWTKEWPAKSTRDPQKLYDNLVVTSNPPKGTLILIDDVFTTGGHVQAAVARLAEKKAECKLAICAGRTVLESPENPFEIVIKEVSHFVPKGK